MLVVGRLLAFSAVHGVPDNAVCGLFAQLHNCGVRLGHKFHNRHGVRMFAAAAMEAAWSQLKAQLSQAAANCLGPTCFRIIFDGVTLPNDCSVLALLVAWSNFATCLRLAVLAMTDW